MRKLILLAGAAAMAASVPALGQGKGGQGKGGGNPHAAHSGGGGQQAQGRGNGRAERGQGAGQARQQQRAERPTQGGGRSNGQAQRAERGNQGQGQGQARQAERREVRAVERQERRADREIGGNGNGNGDREMRDQVRQARGNSDRDWTGWMSRRVSGGDNRFADRSSFFRRGLPLPVTAARDGCPPGLAKQNAFCMPPGQLRKARMIGQRIDRNRFGAVPNDWLYRFRDDDQSYFLYDNDGYIYRVNRENDFVSSIIPLFASNLIVGEPLPLGYDAYNLPVPYRDYYSDSDDHLYRYDDGAIYQVDPQTRLIEGVVALLTGNPINVGSPLPTGYDVYNVPFDYRGRYADDADSMYRYSNGGIYEVDPTTMLVQSLVEMVL